MSSALALPSILDFKAFCFLSSAPQLYYLKAKKTFSLQVYASLQQFSFQIQRKLERKFGRAVWVGGEDGMLEACPSKVCTVRDIWRCSCSSCTRRASFFASCCSPLTSALRCSGALRLLLAYSNRACDNQPAEAQFLCFWCVCVCMCVDAGICFGF